MINPMDEDSSLSILIRPIARPEKKQTTKNNLDYKWRRIAGVRKKGNAKNKKKT